MDSRLAHLEPQPQLVLQQQQLLAVQKRVAQVPTNALQQVENFQPRPRLEENQDGKRLQRLQTALEEESRIHGEGVADELAQVEETATEKPRSLAHFWFRWRSAAAIVMEGISCDRGVSGPSSSGAWGTKGVLETMRGWRGEASSRRKWRWERKKPLGVRKMGCDDSTLVSMGICESWGDMDGWDIVGDRDDDRAIVGDNDDDNDDDIAGDILDIDCNRSCVGSQASSGLAVFTASSPCRGIITGDSESTDGCDARETPGRLPRSSSGKTYWKVAWSALARTASMSFSSTSAQQDCVETRTISTGLGLRSAGWTAGAGKAAAMAAGASDGGSGAGERR